MTITQIHTNVEDLIKNFQKETFIYDFMLAFDFPKASIARLKTGNLNMSKLPGEKLVKKKFWFKELSESELAATMKTIKALPKIKHDPRFVILTDYQTILAYDTKTKEDLATTIQELIKDYAFFLPLAGMEKTQYAEENPADVKAAEKMAKLFDEIKKNNPTDTPEAVHDLNVFLSRLLFCFFAEDTQIFPEDNLFTRSISSHTQEDGSDLQEYLNQLFEVLNTEKRAKNLPKHFAVFPYVNGGLFQAKHPIPVFSKKARKLLLESGDQQWKHINPDIFGSMIQAVVTPEYRGGLGMHYTSVPNIMKVIEPLFLDDLYADFQKSFHSPTKLKRLLLRLENLKIFDPACGSGNFLIIAYKEIRKLELRIFRQLRALDKTGIFIPLSGIELSQFYGIELDDFAHEIASLSLWLAEHQMNTVFREEFEKTRPALPLREGGHIVHGNACRLDWEKVCPKKEGDEIYILGNPPYLGSSLQSKEQKEDMDYVFKGVKSYKNLDYIACWFYKGAKFIKSSNSQVAFVTTNSISQGEQVPILWKQILSIDLEIFFAYQSFKWTNNAKGKAAVIVSIIGLRNNSNSKKYIYNNGLRSLVHNINPYLIEASNVIVQKSTKPISLLPEMDYGSKSVDGGHLTITLKEKEDLVDKNENIEDFIKKYTGSREFINNIPRFCFWITKDNLKKALQIEEIRKRIDGVSKMRLASKKKATRERAKLAYEFGEIRHQKSSSTILIPRVSSQRRKYIPFGFLNDEYVVSDSAQAIYNAETWIFGVLLSTIHITWVKAVGGRLKSDYRYSSVLCYNTFPFPKITDAQKAELVTHVYNVLEQRELHSEKTLAQLYDPDKMPEGLRQAHHELDIAVERCYRKAPFTSDEERLAYLFKLYEKMIAEEAEHTENEKAKKKSKRKK